MAFFYVFFFFFGYLYIKSIVKICCPPLKFNLWEPMPTRFTILNNNDNNYILLRSSFFFFFGKPIYTSEYFTMNFPVVIVVL